MGLMLFNVFVSDLDGRMQYTVKSAGDTKQNENVDTVKVTVTERPG